MGKRPVQGIPRDRSGGSVVGGHTAFAATRSTGGERAVPQMAVLPSLPRYAVNERRQPVRKRR